MGPLEPFGKFDYWQSRLNQLDCENLPVEYFLKHNIFRAALFLFHLKLNRMANFKPGRVDQVNMNVRIYL